MAEKLIISDGSKEEKYALLYSQITALTEGESDTIANMANIASMIHNTFGFWWTGLPLSPAQLSACNNPAPAFWLCH